MTGRLEVDISSRFWSRVKKTKTCWIWTGDTYPDGYGRIWYKRRNIRCNRMVWILVRKQIPNGLHVLHKCDNSLCVRPSHLFLGTHRQNMADMVVKGRSLRGEKHSLAKLTELQVLEALGWYRGCGEKLQDMAARFGVALTTLERIRSGYTWRHVSQVADRIGE